MVELNDLVARILALVNEVLEEMGREQVESIGLETKLREDLGLDSLELAVLTVKVEAAFGVDIFANGNVATIEEVVRKLEES